MAYNNSFKPQYLQQKIDNRALQGETFKLQ